MEYYSAVKKRKTENDILPFTTTEMDLEHITVCKNNKDKFCMF